MGRKLIAMGMGMGRVLFWERGLFYRFMLWMWQWSGNRMMTGIFQLAVPILARAGFGHGCGVSRVFGSGLSW